MRAHRKLVKSLVKDAEEISDQQTIAKAGLMHMALGIAGEVGELIDAIKKHVIYDQPLDLNNLIEELGDLEFYLEGLRQELHLSRDRCLRANIHKLRKRYGQRYSDTAARARADKT